MWTKEDFETSVRRLSTAFDGLQRDDNDSENCECDSICFGWSLVTFESNGGQPEIFLEHLPITRLVSSTSVEEDSCDENDQVYRDEASNLIPDPDCQSKYQGSDTVLTKTIWHLSVVYSHTWQGPVLYFFVQGSNGSPCTRNTIFNMLNLYSDGADSWDFISQDEHPITRLPSFFLHPCQVHARLQTMVSALHVDDSVSHQNRCALRLLSWMSMMLRAIDMPLPSHIFRRLKQRLTVAFE